MPPHTDVKRVAIEVSPAEANSPVADTVWQVGSFQVCPEALSLTSADGVVERVEPRVMALLCYLIGRAGRTVSRQEIHEQVWAGIVVSDDAVHYAISKIRKHFQDDSRTPRYIETVPRFGYRWLVVPGKVDTVSPSTATQTAPPAEITTPTAVSMPVTSPTTYGRRRWLIALACAVVLTLVLLSQWLLPQRPRALAVLAPSSAERAGDDPVLAEFQQQLMLVLAERPELQITGKASVDHLSQRGLGPAELAEQLGVDAVLQSEFRQTGESRQFYFELLSPSDGRILLARQYQAEGPDAVLLTQVSNDLLQYLLPAKNATADGPHTRLQQLTSSSNRTDLAVTEQGLRQRLRSDPQDGRAWAALAELLVAISETDSSTQTSPLLGEAKAAAEQAIQLSPSAPESHLALANVELKLLLPIPARAALDRALRLNPHHALALSRSAELAFREGELDNANRLLNRALQIDPFNMELLGLAGLTAIRQGDLDAALSLYQRQQQAAPDAAGPHRSLAGIYQQLGNWQAALGHFRQAIDKGYNRPVGFLEIAALQRRLGNETEAQAWSAAALSSQRQGPDDLDDWIMQFRLLQPTAQASNPHTVNSPLSRALESFAQGDATLLAQLVAAQPGSFWLNPRTIRVGHYSPAVAVYAWLKATQPERASAWRQQLEQVLQDRHQRLQAFYGAALIRAELASLDGDQIAATTALRQAIALGFADPIRLHNDPWLRNLIATIASERWLQDWQLQAEARRRPVQQAALGWFPPVAD